ncbi:MAG: ribonuclease HII [Saprospiraceae bacterium]
MQLKTYYNKCLYEVGCDEAGRGSLAGPVVAASVILDPKNPIIGLNDSKKLTEIVRKRLRIEIESKALEYAVSFIDHMEIDRINILQASLLAMFNSIKKLNLPINHVIVDGNKKIPNLNIPQTSIIRGDGLYQSIAAASILAKTYRDEYMLKIHDEYPEYLWIKNKGYGSLQHRIAIQAKGLCSYHRLSFKLKELNLI